VLTVLVVVVVVVDGDVELRALVRELVEVGIRNDLLTPV
jgi:hypothetical protein